MSDPHKLIVIDELIEECKGDSKKVVGKLRARGWDTVIRTLQQDSDYICLLEKANSEQHRQVGLRDIEIKLKDKTILRLKSLGIALFFLTAFAAIV